MKDGENFMGTLVVVIAGMLAGGCAGLLLALWLNR